MKKNSILILFSVIFFAQTQGMNNSFDESKITDVIEKIYSSTYKHINSLFPEDIVNKKKLSNFAFDSVYKLIATNPTALSNREKLEYLSSDNYWWFRKGIIKDMIEHEQINPDTIHYMCTTPLRESVIHEDLAFTNYLLEKGATVTEKIKKITTTQEMSDLLKQHLDN